jgi:type I restriction enzyme, R subunit
LQLPLKLYYRPTILAEETGPNKPHDLKADLDGATVYLPATVDEFVKLYLTGSGRETLDPPLDGWRCTSKNWTKMVRSISKAFVKTQGLLSLILPYTNAESEKLSVFLTFLIPKLPAALWPDCPTEIWCRENLDHRRSDR